MEGKLDVSPTDFIPSLTKKMLTVVVSVFFNDDFSLSGK